MGAIADMSSGRYLGVIPARAGSKRLPGKNLRPLAGKPLLAHTIDAARSSRRLTAVVVSTDSVGMARYAASLGIDPQGLRPASLARDKSPVTGALGDALAKFERGHPRVDAVVLLQPTSPFRSGRHIDAAIDLFESSGADTVTSVRAVEDHPDWAWIRAGNGIRPLGSMRKIGLRRDQLPEVFIENGAVYVVARSLIARGRIYGKRVVPLVMDDDSSIDVDTPLDLAWAEFVAARRVRKQARRK